MFSVYNLRPEDVFGFYLNKRPFEFSLSSFICETMYVCKNTCTQNSRKEAASQAGMWAVIAVVEVQAFPRCLIIHMEQASLKMNRQYIKYTLSLPHCSCLSDFVEGF